jgi:hypothetical protein
MFTLGGRKALLAALALGLGGCDAPPKKNPFDPSPTQTKAPPPVKEAPKPSGQPHLTIDTIGAKIGFARVVLGKPESKNQLAQEIATIKEFVDSKQATLAVDRKAKLDWVMLMFEELEKASATSINVKTETRKEYPPELVFTPQGKVTAPAPCSVVAMVMDDYATAVWKLQGGTAGKRSKGFAGPDLTMTLDTIQRQAKACSSSSTVFVSAGEAIEWGLAYDLAASTRTMMGSRFETIVLLRQRPTPGHKVDL